MTKVKQIAFRMHINGQGVVNFDGSEQKFLFLNENQRIKSLGDGEKFPYHIIPRDESGKTTDNVTYAKKNFYRGNDGSLKSSVKISSGCLRNAIFQNDSEFDDSAFLAKDSIQASYVSSFDHIVRGYMQTFKKGNDVIRRTSPLKIMDAVECTNAVPSFEVGTSSGPRDNTSLFYHENIGKCSYISNGFIDIDSMRFIPNDKKFGRISFKEDLLQSGILESEYKLRYGNVPFKSGYYTKTSNIYGIASSEFGIMFDDQFVKYLVKETFKRMLRMNITRSGAYAATSFIEVKFDSNDFNSDCGWTVIKTEEDIDELFGDVEFNNSYVCFSENEVVEARSNAGCNDEEDEETPKKNGSKSKKNN